jgi:hypothetical protein
MLRVDTLESREQPGSVLNGLASGTVTDPLAAMLLIASESALSAPIANSQSSDSPTATGQPGMDEGATRPAPVTTAPVPRKTLDSSETQNLAPVVAPGTSAHDLSDQPVFDLARLATPAPSPSGGAGSGASPGTSLPGPAQNSVRSAQDERPSGGPQGGPAVDQSIAPGGNVAGPKTARVLPNSNPVSGQFPTIRPGLDPRTGPRVLSPHVTQEAPDRATVHEAGGRGMVRLDAHGFALKAVTNSLNQTGEVGGPKLPYGLFGFNVSGPGGRHDHTIAEFRHASGQGCLRPASSVSELNAGIG